MHAILGTGIEEDMPLSDSESEDYLARHRSNFGQVLTFLKNFVFKRVVASRRVKRIMIPYKVGKQTIKYSIFNREGKTKTSISIDIKRNSVLFH